MGTSGLSALEVCVYVDIFQNHSTKKVVAATAVDSTKKVVVETSVDWSSRFV